MMSCATDTKEGRYVVVNNIPGTFLHADIDQVLHIASTDYTKDTCEKQKWQTNVVCKIEKASIWETASSATMLEAARVEIQIKRLQPIIPHI